MSEAKRRLASVLLPLLLGGCVPPPKQCGDFVLSGSLVMPPENASLASPHVAVGPVTEKCVFRASGLPIAIDPMEFGWGCTGTHTNADTESCRVPVVFVRVFDASGKRELGTATYNCRFSEIQSKGRSAGGKKMTAFLVEVETKRHPELDGEFRVLYLLRGVPKEFWKE